MPIIYLCSAKQTTPMIFEPQNAAGSSEKIKKLFIEHFPRDQFQILNGWIVIKPNAGYKTPDDVLNHLQPDNTIYSAMDVKQWIAGKGRAVVKNPKAIFEIELDDRNMLVQLRSVFPSGSLYFSYPCFAEEKYQALWNTIAEQSQSTEIAVRKALHAMCDRYLKIDNFPLSHFLDVQQIKSKIDSQSLQNILDMFEFERIRQLHTFLAENKLEDLWKSEFAGLASAIRKNLLKLQNIKLLVSGDEKKPGPVKSKSDLATIPAGPAPSITSTASVNKAPQKMYSAAEQKEKKDLAEAIAKIKTVFQKLNPNIQVFYNPKDSKEGSLRIAFDVEGGSFAVGEKKKENTYGKLDFAIDCQQNLLKNAKSYSSDSGLAHFYEFNKKSDYLLLAKQMEELQKKYPHTSDQKQQPTVK